MNVLNYFHVTKCSVTGKLFMEQTGRVDLLENMRKLRDKDEETRKQLGKEIIEEFTKINKILMTDTASRPYGFHQNKLDAPCEIVPNLWLGNFSHSIEKNDHSFTKIFNIGVILENQVTDSKYYNVVDAEGTDISPLFHTVCEDIHDQVAKGEKVYVHCYWGWSRSPTIVAAYLIKYHRMTTRQALFHIKKKRSVRPKMSFVKNLLGLEYTKKIGIPVTVN